MAIDCLQKLHSELCVCVFVCFIHIYKHDNDNDILLFGQYITWACEDHLIYTKTIVPFICKELLKSQILRN